MKVNFTPEGYHSITPSLVVKNGVKAIDFYKRAMGATSMGDPFMDPNGKLMHAELTIGDSRFMMSDEYPEMGTRSPESSNGTSSLLYVYVQNVDNTVKQAVDNGAKLLMPVADQFYGDRMGSIKDPFGHVWQIATHIENVTPEEMRKRGMEMFNKKNVTNKS
ncbi:MAG: VOC family protein [bacterium]